MSPRKFLISILFAALPIAATAETAAEVLTTLQWQMSLDAQGRITALRPKGEAVEALRDRMEAAIRQWEFVPGNVDGVAQPTDTLLSVQLGMTPTADGNEYTVRVMDARTGGSVAKATAPRFSRNSMQKLVGNRKDRVSRALMVVEVSYDAAGKLVSTAVAPGSPVQDGPLMDDARKALKSWTFAPERVANAGVPGKVVVPICLAASTDFAAARRQSANCRWVQPGSQASAEDGQSLALDSSVQLKTQVVGSAP